MLTFRPTATQLKMLRSQDVLRTSPLVSRTSPSNVPGTFGDGHDVEFFKGSEDVILRPSRNIRDVLRTFRGPCFIWKCDVPRTFSERPHWCQTRCPVTFPERSETVMM